MKNTINSLGVLLVTSVFLASTASSQQTPEEYEQFVHDHHQRNLEDWKGIVFLCSYDENDPAESAIANRAIADIELLSAVYDLDIRTFRNKTREASFMSALGERVTLTLKLESTKVKNNHDIMGIHSVLSFDTYMLNAVELNAKDDSADSRPKSGDLILWSDTLIATGNQIEIVTPVADAIETQIKEGLTLYLKHNKNKGQTKSP